MLRFLASIGADITPFQRGLSQVGNEWDKHISKQQKKLAGAFGRPFTIGAAAAGAFSVGRQALDARQDRIAATRAGMSVSDWKAIQSAAEETGHSVEEITKNFAKLPEYVKEIVEQKKRQSPNLFGERGEQMLGEAGDSINSSIGFGKKLIRSTATAFSSVGLLISNLAQAGLGGLKSTLGNQSQQAEGEALLQGLFQKQFGLPEGEQMSRRLEERLAAAKAKREGEKTIAEKEKSSRPSSSRGGVAPEVLDALNRIGGFGQGQGLSAAQANERIARATEETARNTRSNGSPY